MSHSCVYPCAAMSVQFILKKFFWIPFSNVNIDPFHDVQQTYTSCKRTKQILFFVPYAKLTHILSFVTNSAKCLFVMARNWTITFHSSKTKEENTHPCKSLWMGGFASTFWLAISCSINFRFSFYKRTIVCYVTCGKTKYFQHFSKFRNKAFTFYI